MELFNVLKKRRSVRAYKSTPISAADLKKILDAAISAPSAGNLQAYDIIIVKNQATKNRLADAAHGQGFVAQAPVVLVFFANPARSAAEYKERGARLYSVQDATIAAAYAQLAATDLGLASCWVGAFNDDAVSAAVKAPTNLKPVAVIPIGRAAEEPGKTPRTRDVVCEKFQ